MKINKNFLVKDGNNYYFRCRIPKDLVSKLKYREIKKSLHTGNLQKAQRVAKLLHDYIEELFTKVRCKMLTPPQIKELVKEAIGIFLQTYEEKTNVEAYMGVFPEKMINDNIINLQENIDFYRKCLITNDLRPANAFIQWLAQVKNYKVETEDATALAREYIGQSIDGLEILLSRATGDRSNPKDNIYSDKNYDLLERALNGSIKSLPWDKQQEVQPAPVEGLKELVDKFCLEKADSGDWRHNTRVTNEGIMKLFWTHFGEDANIASIKREHMLDFRDNVVRKLPTKRNTDPALKGKSIEELLNMSHTNCLSVKTVNDYFSLYHTFFSWFILTDEEKIIKTNPVRKLQLKDEQQAHEKRAPYSEDDIERVLKGFVNIKDSTPKQKIRKEQLEWIILVAMLEATRMKETCQIFVDDIFTVGGIPCIDINKNHETKYLKNAASKRTIPIHPLLIRLGFLGYCLAMKENEDSSTNNPNLLFPAMTFSKQHGYTKNLKNFYGDFNRAFVTKDPQKSFHSYRHSVISTLINMGIPIFHVQCLAGHKRHSETTGTYSHNEIPKLLKVIERLNYNCDIFEILGKEPLSDEVIAEQIKQLPVKE